MEESVRYFDMDTTELSLGCSETAAIQHEHERLVRICGGLYSSEPLLQPPDSEYSGSGFRRQI